MSLIVLIEPIERSPLPFVDLFGLPMRPVFLPVGVRKLVSAGDGLVVPASTHQGAIGVAWGHFGPGSCGLLAEGAGPFSSPEVALLLAEEMGGKLLALEGVGRVPCVTPFQQKRWITWMVDWVIVDKCIRSWCLVQIDAVVDLVTTTHLNSFARTCPTTEAFLNFPSGLQFTPITAEASIGAGSSETVVLG